MTRVKSMKSSVVLLIWVSLMAHTVYAQVAAGGSSGAGASKVRFSNRDTQDGRYSLYVTKYTYARTQSE